MHADEPGSARIWSHGPSERGKNISKTVYISKITDHDQEFKELRIVLMPTTKKIVRVNVSLDFKNIDIPFRKTEISNLTTYSPLVYRFNYTEKERKSILLYL